MNMINRCLLLPIIIVGLSSCASTVGPVGPSFEIMDESELALYNASSSFDEQVICREEIEGWRIFSGAISFREEIKGPQMFFNRLQQARGLQRATYREQPKLCLSVSQLKALKRSAADFGFQGGGYNGGGGESWQPADAADYPSTFN